MSESLVSAVFILFVMMSFLQQGNFQRQKAVRGFKRVCYFAGWASKRENPDARMYTEDIDPFLCTHLIYAFAKINIDDRSLEGAEWDDESSPGRKGNFEKFTDLKKLNPKLKTMVSIGGAHAGSYAFDNIVESAETRWSFIQNAIDFLRNLNFDGLDLDWEYPGLPERGTTPETKTLFNSFVRELWQAFQDEAATSGRRRLLLSAAVGVGGKHVRHAYFVPQLAKHTDFLSLMAYDYHGGWNRFAGGNAPLFSRSHDRFDPRLSVDWSIRKWLAAGAPPWKLVLGISAQARSVRLKDRAKESDVGATIMGHGTPGNYTAEKGVMSYYEVCDMLDEGASERYDSLQSFPYLILGDQWVSYDNRRSVVLKCEYIIRRRLGGAMLWSLDLDDFIGSHCNDGLFPLAATIHDYLEGQQVRDNLAKWKHFLSSATYCQQLTLWMFIFVLIIYVM